MYNYTSKHLNVRREYYVRAALTELNRVTDKFDSFSTLICEINKVKQRLASTSPYRLSNLPFHIEDVGTVLVGAGNALNTIERMLAELDGALNAMGIDAVSEEDNSKNDNL